MGSEMCIRDSPNTHRYLEGPRKTLVDIISGFFITEASNCNERLRQQAYQEVELRQWFFYISKDVDYIDSCQKLSSLNINWSSAFPPSDQELAHPEESETFSSIVLGIEKMKVSF